MLQLQPGPMACIHCLEVLLPGPASRGRRECSLLQISDAHLGLWSSGLDLGCPRAEDMQMCVHRRCGVC
jgi:hypothetical protein